jgi:hypothetical protein
MFAILKKDLKVHENEHELVRHIVDHLGRLPVLPEMRGFITQDQEQ